MILSFTGHRTLGGFTVTEREKMYKLAYDFLRQAKQPIVITGMAVGWDTEVCSAAVDLGCEVRAYVPFVGQEKKWPQASQDRYHELLSKCEVIICSEGEYAAWKLHHRNERMVNAGDVVIAFWNGEPGGTGSCVKYAEKVGKPIINLFPYFDKEVPKFQ